MWTQQSADKLKSLLAMKDWSDLQIGENACWGQLLIKLEPLHTGEKPSATACTSLNAVGLNTKLILSRYKMSIYNPKVNRYTSCRLIVMSICTKAFLAEKHWHTHDSLWTTQEESKSQKENGSRVSLRLLRGRKLPNIKEVVNSTTWHFKDALLTGDMALIWCSKKRCKGK